MSLPSTFLLLLAMREAKSLQMTLAQQLPLGYKHLYYPKRITHSAPLIPRPPPHNMLANTNNKGPFAIANIAGIDFVLHISSISLSVERA
jgi:hypothetical protein